MEWNIKDVIIGKTTYDDVLKMDPNMKSVMTSYGYQTFHKIQNNTAISIKFVYRNGEFIVDDIDIIE